MSKFLLRVLAFVASAGLAGLAGVGDLTPAAARLAQRLDHTGVERLWLAGVHVDWETGVPDGKPMADEGRHTHCSAFVAAIAERLGIYLESRRLPNEIQNDFNPQKGGFRPRLGRSRY